MGNFKDNPVTVDPEAIDAVRKSIGSNIPSPGNTSLAYPGDANFGMNDLARNSAYEDAIRASISGGGVNYMDYKALQSDSPITQQGYSGKTFTVPTIAAGGVVFPYSIFDKKRRAAIEAEKQDALQSLSMDYQVAQVKDVVSNAIFIKKQAEDYDVLAQNTAKQLFKGDVGKAHKYLSEEGTILKRKGIEWNNFKNAYDIAWENYLKIQNDPNSLGTSKYSQRMREMMKGFGDVLNDPGSIDPSQIGKLAAFTREFNQMSSINEMAINAAKVVKPEYDRQLELLRTDPDFKAFADVSKFVNIDVETAWKVFGGGADYSEEQKQLFGEALKAQFEQKIQDPTKFVNTTNMELERMKLRSAEGIAAKKAKGDTEKDKKYVYSPGLQPTAFNTEEVDYTVNINGRNVFNLTPVSNPVQISAQKGYTVGKKSGALMNVDENIDFDPRFVADFYTYSTDILYSDVPGSKWKNVTKPEDGLLIPKGAPIPDDLMKVLIDQKGADVVCGKVSVKTFAEGQFTTKQAKAEDRVSGTVLIPYSEVKGDLEASYKGLRDDVTSISQSGQVVTPEDLGTSQSPAQTSQSTNSSILVKPTASVAKYNQAKGTNYTLEELQKAFGTQYNFVP